MLPLAEDAAVAEPEEDETPLEPDPESTAENRSCINFLNAWRAFCTEPIELADEEDLSEVVFQLGGWPPGSEGIEIPIWLNACMMLCISLSFPLEYGWLPDAWAPGPAALLFDCGAMEKWSV